MKIVGNIYEEENYDVFRKLDDNRDVLSARLSKLIASISERYVLNPIVVNEKMQIIDGQGRYEAAKALHLPVYYVISPGSTSDDCRRMNRYNTKWSQLDFAKSYAQAGKKAYQLLLLACKETGYSIFRVLRITNHASKPHRNSIAPSVFEKGNLNFTDQDVQTAKDIKTHIDGIISALQFTGRINEAFVSAVKVAYDTDGYNHARMLRNCERCRSTYVQMATLTDQLVEFERIYNNKTPLNKKLYFSDYMRNKGYNVRDYSKTSNEYTDKDVSTLR